MKPAPDPGAGDLERMLAQLRGELVAFVRRRAGGTLLRLESADDLVQGFCAHVIERGLDRSLADDRARRAWLLRVADNYLKDRRDHWSALKRGGCEALRLSLADHDASGLREIGELAASVTGPSTFAMRREQVAIAALALDMLLPRDRELIEGLCAGRTLEEEARTLGLSRDSAGRARERAVERFRRVFRLTLQARA